MRRPLIALAASASPSASPRTTTRPRRRRPGSSRGTAPDPPAVRVGWCVRHHDIAVIVLERAVTGITPAKLPARGRLDRLQAQHVLDDKTFTAVGYGTVHDDETGGPHGFEDPEGVRRFAL
jgi:hypothetical protein